MALRIGDMLVAAGFVTEEQVREALTEQRSTGRRLGEELVSLGFVTEVQLIQVLSNQLSVPWVSLHHIEMTRELLLPHHEQLACLIGGTTAWAEAGLPTVRSSTTRWSLPSTTMKGGTSRTMRLMPPTIAARPTLTHWWRPVMPPTVTLSSMVTCPLQPTLLAMVTSFMIVQLWPT